MGIVAPAILALACGAAAMRDEIRGRGAEMAWGYPLGFVIQLFFGMIALWAAKQIWPRAEFGSLWLAMLRIAAIHAAFDALHVALREYPLTEAAVQGIVSIGLFLILFRGRDVPALGSAALVYVMKVVSAMMIQATVFTVV